MHKLLRALSLPIMVLIAGSAALAQSPRFVAPHSNDPHPPANQPSYQLPSPLARPGVPGFPGAPHSNDPHYRKVEPQIVWPSPPPVLPPGPVTARPRRYEVPYGRQSEAERRATQKRAEARRQRRAGTTLQQCYARWDRGLGVSRASWESTCRRLAADGRIRTR